MPAGPSRMASGALPAPPPPLPRPRPRPSRRFFVRRRGLPSSDAEEADCPAKRTFLAESDSGAASPLSVSTSRSFLALTRRHPQSSVHSVLQTSAAFGAAAQTKSQGFAGSKYAATGVVECDERDFSSRCYDNTVRSEKGFNTLRCTMMNDILLTSITSTNSYTHPYVHKSMHICLRAP